MPFVCAERIGFSFVDRICILGEASFRLAPGWHGLVGANGSGKTTLARLIAGELRPTVGRLWVEPAGAKVVVCAQELSEATDELRRFARASDRESCRQRGALGLDATALDRFSTLSPGERKRWQLAVALAQTPDVLIVDEPTNHLDEDGRRHLIEILSRFRGIGIAISHDRELLATLTTMTLRIHAQTVESYSVSYAGAREQWLAATARSEDQRRQLVSEESQLAQRIAVTNRDRDGARRSRSASMRMKGIHDHDGNSFAQTRRAANGEARISRRLGVMRESLRRTQEKIPDFEVDKTLGRSIFLDYRAAPMPQILGIWGEDLRVGGTILLRDVCVTLARGAKVHLKGPNGAGKTTLIQALLERGETSRGHVLYLPQELTPAQVLQQLVHVRRLPPTERGRLMSLICALGADPERLLVSDALSPGEARKLWIALGIAVHSWALVLDEPTNHLDLPSIERLECALVAYPGALLLVSHDVRFAATCTDCAWELKNGTLEV